MVCTNEKYFWNHNSQKKNSVLWITIKRKTWIKSNSIDNGKFHRPRISNSPAPFSPFPRLLSSPPSLPYLLLLLNAAVPFPPPRPPSVASLLYSVHNIYTILKENWFFALSRSKTTTKSSYIVHAKGDCCGCREYSSSSIISRFHNFVCFASRARGL